MLPLIPLLPFAGFLVNVALGRRLSKAAAGAVAVGALGAAFAAALVATWPILTGEARVLEAVVYRWISAGDLDLPFAFRLDPLGAVMVLVVTGIGALIHLYSVGYMHEEPDAEYARYFSYLNLFAAFMLVLVMAANLPVLFVGWEGVGLCSYLLIGFWYHKPAAADAGKKAFVVNRIGDFGFLLGMLLVFKTFGTFDFAALAAQIAPREPETTAGILTAIALLLFVGATGKSAQIPLYVWLPDAMEGPTPVSALIHAATMVTAGVYMIGRTAVLFGHAPLALEVVAVVGVATALLAATIGLVQHDIKRVLAYSTVSQLGFMFLAMGVGAYAAGIFHLYTHAFFKALLFLGSGAVIHALGGEQDLRRMGGLRRDLPVTYWTFLVGACAISGVPLLSGFFSKDEILFRTFASGHRGLWALAALTSCLTAVYMFRLVFRAFHGAPTAEAAAAGGHAAGTHGGAGGPVHEAPRSMAIPLVVLAVGSIVAGYVGVPHVLGGENRIERFLEPSFHPPGVAPVEAGPGEAAGLAAGGPGADGAAALELALMAVSVGLALGGIALAAYFFLRHREAADRLAARVPRVYRLLLGKYYVDELYDAVFVQPTKALAATVLWRGIDAGLIDGIVDGVGRSVRGTGGALRRLQTGSVRVYAASLFLGVVLVIGYYLWR
jgi:NADH-quinone oxidoreductase subunit L